MVMAFLVTTFINWLSMSGLYLHLALRIIILVLLGSKTSKSTPDQCALYLFTNTVEHKIFASVYI